MVANGTLRLLEAMRCTAGASHRTTCGAMWLMLQHTRDSDFRNLFSRPFTPISILIAPKMLSDRSLNIGLIF